MSATDLVLSLVPDACGRLVATLASGAQHVGVEPVQTFPWSAADSPIALVGSDGRQVALIESPALLPAELQQTLRQELQQREFVPVILRILATSQRYAPCDWSVETDRGLTRIHIESDDDIRPLRPRAFLVSDRSGRRFQIPDSDLLDAGSRNILQRVT